MHKPIYLLLIILLVACAARADTGHAVAFMYHRVGDDRFPSTNVTLEAFEAQLDYLERQGFTVWPLDRITEHLKSGRPLPDRTVAITIDDAYRSVFENAWPRLRARGWPFTVFVSTDPIDDGLRDYMSWDQMRSMQAAGVTFANHSASHDHLALRRPGESDDVWRTRVREDIGRAERRLREELGDSVNPGRLFAYPFGEYSEALAELVSELGYTAFGQHSGALGVDADRSALPRYPINEHYSDLNDFAVKANSLPLPVRSMTPRDPLVAENPPRLEVVLGKGEANLDRLACYRGAKRLAIEWLDREQGRFAVRAAAPLPPGRDRYNCTAPHPSGRWYWFSQPWLVAPDETVPGR